MPLEAICEAGVVRLPQKWRSMLPNTQLWFMFTWSLSPNGGIHGAGSRDLKYSQACSHLLFVGVGKGRKAERLASESPRESLAGGKIESLDDRGWGGRGEGKSRADQVPFRNLRLWILVGSYLSPRPGHLWTLSEWGRRAPGSSVACREALFIQKSQSSCNPQVRAWGRWAL